MTLMKIAILGRTHWLLESAMALRTAGHTISLVATSTPSPEYLARPDDFSVFAAQNNCPYFFEPNINSESFINYIRGLDIDIGVSINWPTLIGPEACAVFKHGILNSHLGDLPRYRGNACPNWAILQGESKIGLCIHQMDPHQVDAGPVFVRRYLTITNDTYVEDVYRWTDSVEPSAFVEALEHVANPDFYPAAQEKTGVRPLRTHPRRPEDGAINWQQSAAYICRLVRASSKPFGGAFSFFEGKVKVTIWRARVVDLSYDVMAVPGQIIGRGEAGGVMVACGEGVIEIENSEMADGRNLPASNRYRLMSAQS